MSMPLRMEHRVFRIGDAVEVLRPTSCPVIDAAVVAGRWRARAAITGYSGVITDLRYGLNGRLMVTLEWDAVTHDRTSSEWRRFWAWERCSDQRFGYATLDSRCLRHIPARDDPPARARAREETEGYFRCIRAKAELYRAAGAPLELVEFGKVHATVFRYRAASCEEGDRILESDNADTVFALAMTNELIFIPGTTRVDGRLTGTPQTARAIAKVRAAGGEAMRVILEWVERAMLMEREVVVEVQPALCG